jgi:ribonuclease R
VGRKNRRTYMLGDRVEVVIQKVDVLRHQIDLAVVLPEGDGTESAAVGPSGTNQAEPDQADASEQVPSPGTDREDNALAGSSSEG